LPPDMKIVASSHRVPPPSYRRSSVSVIEKRLDPGSGSGMTEPGPGLRDVRGDGPEYFHGKTVTAAERMC
jgi:hypothetical protein